MGFLRAAVPPRPGRVQPSARPGNDDEARSGLLDALAHERQKVDRLKRRLARIEADQELHRTETRALYSALMLDRRPPRLGTAETPVWADLGARARRAAQARASDLGRDREAAAAAGGALFGTPPPPVALTPKAWRPLRLALASSATSAFMGCADPRVIVRPVGDPLVEEADVLVFPSAESAAYLDDARHVPEALWRRVADGLTQVVLDASGEGHPHTATDSEAHHSFLQRHGVDPTKALYLTQDRQYPADYEAWRRRQSVRPMRVWIFDAFIRRVLSDFQLPGAQVFNHRLAQYLRRPARRSRRFMSLNYTPRPTKVFFLMRLLQDGLWDQGWISFGGLGSDGSEDAYDRAAILKRLRAMEGFCGEVEALLPALDRLEAMEPVVFMAEKHKLHGKQRTRALQAMDLEQYGDSWFSVVTETEMNPRLHRITEKPLKPLLAFHPFLILGSPGSLDLLRGYGFETFGGVFDERYDQEPDPYRRFNMVHDQVRRLCTLDEAELARISAELSEIVVFNACWGLTELPRRFNEKVVAELVDQLLPEARAGKRMGRLAPPEPAT